MQQEIIKGIREFFDENLSRKPNDAEIQKLHDDFTPDYEGMLEYATKKGLTYTALLKRTLTDAYADEISCESNAYRTAIKFNTAANALLHAVKLFKEASEEVLGSKEMQTVVNMIGGDPDSKVTILEPMMTKVMLDDALKVCADAALKEYVMRKDPKFELKDYKGVCWYTEILKEGRLTVDSVKRVREVFGGSYISIIEGKRVVELVLKGTIVAPN